MINVNKPFLPPVDEYKNLLDGIWKRNWLTNNGPLENELELRLKEYLGLNHLLFVTNGTIALQFAMRLLELKGEVITTPFSFVATASSIAWENCKPLFVDIDKDTFNIDASKIEQAITKNTSAILATHVYGNPCDIDSIEKVAKKNNLKVIYDAAHCFGTKYKGKSVYSYGDISTASFHATKIFHSVEGGAVITNSPELTKKASRMRNFGFADYDKFEGIGINGKNSEFHAAMGLCNLKYAEEILKRRKEHSAYYDSNLKTLRVVKPLVNLDSDFNFAYYPIIFESESILLKSKEELEKNRISTRRYFYPVLSKLNYAQGYNTPIAEDAAKRVLCLPLYYDLSNEEIDLICRILLRTQNN